MIRVHEPEQAYDTQVHMLDTNKTFDVPYHTRYKKIKKTVRKVESQGLDAGVEIEEQVDMMKSIEWIRLVGVARKGVYFSIVRFQFRHLQDADT